MRFNVHDAKPACRPFGNNPVLFFSHMAIQKMMIYVATCEQEVGWLGLVDVYDNNCYLCTDVHLLHQEVNGGTTEITPEGLVLFAEEVGFDEMAKCHLWGHSHVNMGTSASSQDEDQMSLFKENSMEWFFRIICNKSGKISVSFYDYKAGYVIDDCKWEEYSEVVIDEEAVKAEIKDKVKPKTYAVTKFTGGATTVPPEAPGRGKTKRKAKTTDTGQTTQDTDTGGKKKDEDDTDLTSFPEYSRAAKAFNEYFAACQENGEDFAYEDFREDYLIQIEDEVVIDTWRNLENDDIKILLNCLADEVAVEDFRDHEDVLAVMTEYSITFEEWLGLVEGQSRYLWSRIVRFYEVGGTNYGL